MGSAIGSGCIRPCESLSREGEPAASDQALAGEMALALGVIKAALAYFEAVTPPRSRQPVGHEAEGSPCIDPVPPMPQ